MRQGQFDIEKAISRACKAAARTIEQLGCQESIPWKDELVVSSDTNVANHNDNVEPSVSTPGQSVLVHAMEASHITKQVLEDDTVPTVNGIRHLTPPLSNV